MNASELVRRLWERLARRSSVARRRTQRLTGFEPLEPRTVLSASGMHMFGGDGFAGPRGNDFYHVEPPGRQLGRSADFAHADRQPMAGDRLVSPSSYDAAVHDAIFTP